jgi:hypothetical protein
MTDLSPKEHKGHFGMCPLMAVIILVSVFQIYRLKQLKKLLTKQEDIMTPAPQQPVQYAQVAQVPVVTAPSNIVYMPINTSMTEATKNDMN